MNLRLSTAWDRSTSMPTRSRAFQCESHTHVPRARRIRYHHRSQHRNWALLQSTDTDTSITYSRQLHGQHKPSQQEMEGYSWAAQTIAAMWGRLRTKMMSSTLAMTTNLPSGWLSYLRLPQPLPKNSTQNWGMPVNPKLRLCVGLE